MTPQQQASEWLLNCQILDTETTGLDGQAEIVEISIIDQDGNVVFDSLGRCCPNRCSLNGTN